MTGDLSTGMSGLPDALAAMLLARNRADLWPLLLFLSELDAERLRGCAAALAGLLARTCDWPEDLVRGWLLDAAAHGADR